ncbi:hypothetical protein ACFY72_04610 [Streptomyces globisporus]|uniref:hypothetical protein n=1 Tax=Streptomyces albovinaceus subgroup TaxID=1482558 RepID=UPI001780BA72|nr:hypothetical protein [Streptomyces albovinaceus]
MNRRAAVEAPAASAKRQLLDAVDDAHLDTALPLVVLHRATVNMRRFAVLGASRSAHLALNVLTTGIWTPAPRGGRP